MIVVWALSEIEPLHAEAKNPRRSPRKVQKKPRPYAMMERAHEGGVTALCFGPNETRCSWTLITPVNAVRSVCPEVTCWQAPLETTKPKERLQRVSARCLLAILPLSDVSFWELKMLVKTIRMR